ncbi:predicted protein [Pyrenophora tritici-repentis Pt-1C-BFP]|uniref:Uncharacterized protein n=1 Tax=Pyrenophora tritici-repentis (strain Pt-1C-BFP) TaxID=426418 RepID=B2W0D1_PYRTR|nr:uncharacterized protein PTRG_03916 [Pyrenophora tritici-repentis Pt-1C-BFP]EDU46754.1 predicted protein [Pyrenophora tritici-repentis Pt-1C-BFP]
MNGGTNRASAVNVVVWSISSAETLITSPSSGCAVSMSGRKRQEPPTPCVKTTCNPPTEDWPIGYQTSYGESRRKLAKTSTRPAPMVCKTFALIG